jgi:hypothetical protein
MVNGGTFDYIMFSENITIGERPIEKNSTISFFLEYFNGQILI